MYPMLAKKERVNKSSSQYVEAGFDLKNKTTVNTIFKILLHLFMTVL
jgi:hypothetical protein